MIKIKIKAIHFRHHLMIIPRTWLSNRISFSLKMILEEAPYIKQLIKVCLDRCHPMGWTMNSFQVLEILKQFSFLKETVVITPRNSQMCSKV